MTYKEFDTWCSERAADGCLGMANAMTCFTIIKNISKLPFWKRKQEWKNLNQEFDVFKKIVLPINQMIEQQEFFRSHVALNPNDNSEFIGQIVDIFEDFLGKRGIELKNDEKNDEDADMPANIYGTDYGELQTKLENMMIEWKIIRGIDDKN